MLIPRPSGCVGGRADAAAVRGAKLARIEGIFSCDSKLAQSVEEQWRSGRRRHSAGQPTGSGTGAFACLHWWGCRARIGAPTLPTLWSPYMGNLTNTAWWSQLHFGRSTHPGMTGIWHCVRSLRLTRRS